MKKANLYFQIELKYQTKAFKPLADLGIREYDNKKKIYKWLFHVNNIQKVLAILGKPLAFEPKEADLVEKYTPPRKKVVKQGPKQGKGFVHVQLHPTKPNYFVVTTVRERQPQNTNVSFETVQALWKVIKKQPKDKIIKTATVAKNYCDELGIVDFNTYKDGKFNWKYFSGSRKYYLVFYAAIKVLCHYGVIDHVVQGSKSGVKRKADTWSIQTELE